MGDADSRAKIVGHVKMGCRIAAQLRDLGVRPCGIVRIDSTCSWDKDPKGNTKTIIQTFNEAAKVATGYGERLAAEGEICWGAMHNWKYMLQVLEGVGQPKHLGFQADMAHTLLIDSPLDPPLGNS